MEVYRPFWTAELGSCRAANTAMCMINMVLRAGTCSQRCVDSETAICHGSTEHVLSSAYQEGLSVHSWLQ